MPDRTSDLGRHGPVKGLTKAAKLPPPILPLPAVFKEGGMTT
ncbi:MAG TPA: hypothetical protein VI670_07955 [Thermoanaerobaculia bacterium]|jgi:hypothetical protein